MRIGDTVRPRPGTELEALLGEAAELTGVLGDVRTDERSERISVVFEAPVLAYGVAATAFEPAAPVSGPERR